MSFPHLTSLEFLTVGLKSSQVQTEKSLTDNAVLRTSNSLDFSGLKRFKIFGDSNLMPLTDEDLFFISRTAVNLEEIHITGSTSVTIKGTFTFSLLLLPGLGLYSNKIAGHRGCCIGCCFFQDAQAS